MEELKSIAALDDVKLKQQRYQAVLDDIIADSKAETCMHFVDHSEFFWVALESFGASLGDITTKPEIAFIVSPLYSSPLQSSQMRFHWC